MDESMMFTVGDVLRTGLQLGQITLSRYLKGLWKFDISKEVWGQDGITFIELCNLYSFLNENNMKKELQKVKAVQDESCHWYIIPMDRMREFYEDNEFGINEEMDCDEFNTKWCKYRTGGDLNNVQLYAEI